MENKKEWDAIMLIALLALFVVYHFVTRKPREEIIVPGPQERDTMKIDSSFNEKALIRYMDEVGIIFADIVYAQAVLETGSFRSKVFRVNNNLFGMKVAKSRPTTALGLRRGHAFYKDWRMSVVDYALFQSAYTRKIRTEEGYYKYLSRNYATDVTYVNKLRVIVNKSKMARR